MKFRIWSVALITLLVACDESPSHMAPTWGNVNVLVNGKKWGAQYPSGYKTIVGVKGNYGTAIPCQSPYYVISSDIYTGSGFLRESLNFIKVPFVQGKHKVIDHEFQCVDGDPVAYSYFATTSQDGDVGQDWYDVLETEDNYIVIDSFDDKSFEVKGSFQVTFIIGYRSPNDPSSLPDTLRFTNGTFHTKIVKRYR